MSRHLPRHESTESSSTNESAPPSGISFEDESFSEASFEVYSVCDTCDRRNDHRTHDVHLGGGSSEFDTTRHIGERQLAAAAQLNMGQLGTSQLATIPREPAFQWLPLEGRGWNGQEKGCPRRASSRGVITLIGVVGVAIGLAGLVSYGIMQIPPFREYLGETWTNVSTSLILSIHRLLSGKSFFSRASESKQNIYSRRNILRPGNHPGRDGNGGFNHRERIIE